VFSLTSSAFQRVVPNNTLMFNVFSLTSSAFQNGQSIPPQFAAGPLLPNDQRTFGNNSPPLAWHHPPVGTESFALIMNDESVSRSEGGFSHWVIFNIPAGRHSLPAGIPKVPEPFGPHGAQQGLNGEGEDGYLGPAPPRGDPPHDYVFRLYALNTRLTLQRTETWRDLRRAMSPPGGPNHILGRATLKGTFQTLVS
jgi:Raf kinase inhibitor-like YbhB/YbcL family protein